MDDIELVIKIDKDVFTRLFDNGTENYGIANDDLFDIARAIRKGTPLPEGHGRLKDVDKIEALLDLDKADNEIAKALKNIMESVPTIIEADKESD